MRTSWNRYFGISAFVGIGILSAGWINPCVWCGVYPPADSLVGPTNDILVCAAHQEQLANQLSDVKNALTQLRTITSAYQDLKQIYGVIGRVKNTLQNFSLSNVLDTWEISDFKELKNTYDLYRTRIANNDWVGSAMQSADSASGNSAPKEKSTFATYLSGISDNLKSGLEVATPYANDFISTSEELAYFSWDRIMSGIMAIEQKNVHMSAVAAAAANTAEKSVAAEVNVSAPEDASIASALSSQIATKAADTTAWSNLSNSVMLGTQERLVAYKLQLKQEQDDVLTICNDILK